MRYVFALLSLLLGVVSVVAASESDGAATIQWQTNLQNLGGAGLFISYLICDRYIMRGDKLKENERWEKADERLFNIIVSDSELKEKLIHTLTEQRTTNTDLVTEVKRLVTIITTGSDHRRRSSD